MTIAQNHEIVIIGAGLTGLVLAHQLKKQGKKVLLIEKDERAGGVIHTRSEDGFVFESGPNTGVLSNPELVELFEELTGVTLETANKDSKNRWILKNNKFRPLPSGLWSGITTPLFSWYDKFRILGEPWRKPGTNPNETLANLVRRRMGKSFLNYAVDPFISGIYAGDPETLIPKYALPKLYNLEQAYGSFIKGGMAKHKEPKSDRDKKATKEVFSATNGLQKLVDALELSIGKENIWLHCQNTTVQPAENGFIVKTNQPNPIEIHAKQVITTIAAPHLAALLPFVPQSVMAPISNLEYAKVVQVVLGYKNWTGRKLNAFGGLIPKLENRKVLGILFPSAIFSNRAPKQGALLSVFMGGMRHPELIDMNDEGLLKMAKETVGATLNEHNQADLQKVFKYHHAIPQYTISTPEKLDAIAKIEQQHKGLLLAGNIRDGIGMADRVKQAVEMAKTLTNEH